GRRQPSGTKRKRGRDVETQAEVNLKITERLEALEYRAVFAREHGCGQIRRHKVKAKVGLEY
ncbi:MAG: hypothetical protein MJ109_06070, partial [Kiritimatiellae bacterium]|nr:hypothetical protein [Kiritimatiellia bacterium]